MASVTHTMKMLKMSKYLLWALALIGLGFLALLLLLLKGLCDVLWPESPKSTMKQRA